MYFEYNQYFRGCFFVPAIVILLLLLMLALEVFHFVQGMRKKNLHRNDFFKVAIVFVLFGFFLSMNVGRLANGGIYLIQEKEHDSIVVQGKIDSIEDLGPFEIPRLDSDYGYSDAYGVRITVDGIACTAVTQGDLIVGDYVTVEFLPRSGYVLSVFKAGG